MPADRFDRVTWLHREGAWLVRLKRGGLGWILIAWFLVITGASPALLAQSDSVSETLLISASSASNWADANTNILQLQGPITITMDNARATADDAVIWFTPQPGGLLGEQQVEIALIGNATMTSRDNHLSRTGSRLLINAVARGAIQLTAPEKYSQDLSKSALFQEAQLIRNYGESEGETSLTQTNTPLTTTAPPPPPPVGGTSAAGVIQPPLSKTGKVDFSARLTEPIDMGDGLRAYQLTGGVTITRTADSGDFLELLADNAVLFTSDRQEESGKQTPGAGLGHHITAVYLEGDVRVNFTPAAAKKPEQRLTADRVYYDFVTDRAILTNVVLHTINPETQTPITVRAKIMHQLAQGEYVANKVEFTTSKFAVPMMSMRSSYAYIRQEPEDPGTFDVNSRNDTVNIMGAPVFYLPWLWGTIDNKPFPLRTLGIGNSSRFGYAVTSDWGLFETLGQTPPKNLDISYRIDNYADRGFGGGFDGKYSGGFITDTGESSGYQGDFTAFMLSDKGVDNLGGNRALVTPPTKLRGRFEWEHEQFLPDNWEVQVRAGYVSDPTFNEEYYQGDFDNGLPFDAEFYAKRQQDTEVLTFLAQTDTTRFITNFDRQQEQFDVARLPEITYQRIGDSVGDDQLTFFGNVSGSALKVDKSAYSIEDQGFSPTLSPGLPSDGTTGLPGGFVYRGDSRDELDWPVALGEFKFVPYMMGEATAYSNSPGGDTQNRLYGGLGMKATTSFWTVDDSVDSDLFDLHRIRHIIQPEVNLFTSGTTVDQEKLYIFDPNIDAINAISAAQFALHQHWETMRGGPGRWESVDIFDFNVEADYYAHQPPPSVLNPVGFRGLFFPSEPETSVARQAINGDATWHIADDTAFISDAQWNMDTRELAIVEGGLAINRGSRLSYYVGDAYIQQLQSQVFTLSATYNLTTKYQLAINQALDFGASRAAVTYFALTRRFETFAVQVSVYHDGINNVNGFNVNLLPQGAPGFSAPWRAND